MENGKFKWSLNAPQFSWLDKIKVAKYILFNDQWTQGKEVAKFEKAMAEFVNCRYCVFVSSGSTANTLLAMRLKDNKKDLKKSLVIFPSTTWTTSVAPFIREGFEPYFMDINLDDFSIDLDKLEDFLRTDSHKVACVFITSLIGFVPNMKRLKDISLKYDVKIMLDNCENTLGTYYGANVSSFFTSTTSTYFGHQIQSVEGGFIFTNDVSEYEYFLMARSHGMVRNLSAHAATAYKNQAVDEKFDFYLLGNNFRNTNINAVIGQLDLKRAEKYQKRRVHLYKLFKENVRQYNQFYFPKDTVNKNHVPFCIPLISANKSYDVYLKSRAVCALMGIETRPIISGNLLRQTCYRKYSIDPSLYKNSDYLHKYGFYIGLHAKVKEQDIIDLTKSLNKA